MVAPGPGWGGLINVKNQQALLNYSVTAYQLTTRDWRESWQDSREKSASEIKKTQKTNPNKTKTQENRPTQLPTKGNNLDHGHGHGCKYHHFITCRVHRNWTIHPQFYSDVS